MQVYLDNSATTRPCDEAVRAVALSMTEEYYNPSALYAPALRAERALADARRAIAKTLRAGEKNVLFTSGGTESDNLAIWGWLMTRRKPGEVLFSAAEHAAVRNACIEAEGRFGARAREIPLLRSGTPDLSALEAMLGPETTMICAMQVCNETGVVMPLEEICALRDRLAPQAAIHVDGVQGYLRAPFSFQNTKVQFYALSAHKIHGPKGVGALVMADGVRIKPLAAGGGQQGGLRSGTENTGGVAGLLAAVKAYPPDGMAHMRAMKRLLWSLLIQELPDMAVVGLPTDDPMSAGHILNVAFPPVRAETLLHALEADGICVGTGSACSSKKGKRSAVLTAMRLDSAVIDGAIRISLCPSNTEEEMRYTAGKMIEQVRRLRRFTRR